LSYKYNNKLQVLEILREGKAISVKVKFPCGHERILGYKYLKTGKVVCSVCYNKNKLSKEEFEERFNSKYKGKFELLSEYKGSSRKVLVKCKNCNAEFIIRGHNALYLEIHCPYCYKLAKKYKDYKRVKEFKEGVIY
ncbi:MAG: hypothetical protein N3A59_09385, partial [Thermodesulfovibrionales bacterium]|nr:hypothetical protein [Thermodesulfovibrionales bacterium]